MNPIAFQFPNGFEIHWYGIMIALGFLASVYLMKQIRRFANISDDQVYTITMLALISGIIGARVFYVIQFHDQFTGYGFFQTILKIVNIRSGGIVFYGGFIGGFSTSIIYAKRQKISITALLDILSPSIILAHAFGRIGCFLQGCCCGGPAPDWFPLAVCYPRGSLAASLYPDVFSSIGNSLPVYPVQLFESAGNLIICGVLLYLLYRHRKYPGMITSVYLVMYAILRFLLEFLRGDHHDFFLGMTPAQNIALFLMVPTAIVITVASLSRQKKALIQSTDPTPEKDAEQDGK